MSGQPQKFIFNTNFDLNPKDTEQKNPFYIKGYGIGFERGKQQGEALVRESVEFKLSESMQAIISALGQLHGNREAFFEHLEEETVGLSRLIVSKILSAQRQEDYLEEILTLVRKTMKDVRESSGFLLKLPVGLKDSFLTALQKLPQDFLDLNQLEVVEEGSLGAFDCEFHWKDGFSALHGSAFRDQIAAIFSLPKETGEQVPGE